jgi:hypothetical protein
VTWVTAIWGPSLQINIQAHRPKKTTELKVGALASYRLSGPLQPSTFAAPAAACLEQGPDGRRMIVATDEFCPPRPSLH